MFPSISQPGIGDVPTTNNALKFTGHPADPKVPAPRLGENNEEIFQDFIGLSEDRLRELQEKKVI